MSAEKEISVQVASLLSWKLLHHLPCTGIHSKQNISGSNPDLISRLWERFLFCKHCQSLMATWLFLTKLFWEDHARRQRSKRKAKDYIRHEPEGITGTADNAVPRNHDIGLSFGPNNCPLPGCLVTFQEFISVIQSFQQATAAHWTDLCWVVQESQGIFQHHEYNTKW